MNIIQNINDKLYELFKSYDDVEAYVCKWQVFYDDFGNANFYIQYKDNEHKKIDLKTKFFCLILIFFGIKIARQIYGKRAGPIGPALHV